MKICVVNPHMLIYWKKTPFFRLLLILSDYCGSKLSTFPQSHLYWQRTMWLFLTSFCRLFLYRSRWRWQAEGNGCRTWISCIEKENWIRFAVLTGSTSDSPWSRPADKRCVFMKNRLATAALRVTINKAACLLPLSPRTAWHSACSLKTRLTISWPCPTSSIPFLVTTLKVDLNITISPLHNKSIPASYVAFAALPSIYPQPKPQCLLQMKQHDVPRQLPRIASEHI